MAMTHETQKLLTEVDGTAPMGGYLRENFWFPACRSGALEPDAPPKAVRLIGENFVAFRSTDGRVGFFREGCPHRGVSLLLGRNEDNALTCIFHGWKFGVDGTVVDVPTQRINREAFCKNVPLQHFPVEEAAGLVWVWLGKGVPKPRPKYDFDGLPEAQVHVTHQHLPYNWIQGIEGQVDTAHITQLHKDLVTDFDKAGHGVGSAANDAAPDIEFDDFPGGFRYGAIRDGIGEDKSIRITVLALPWFSHIPLEGGTVLIHVPEDNTSTALYIIRYNKHGELKPTLLNPVEDPENFPPYLPGGGRREERWGQNTAIMKTTSWSGYTVHAIQEDYAVAASQGVIADRTTEFLNAADLAVVRARKLMIDAVQQWQAGTPVQVKEPEMLSAGLTVPPGTDWRSIRPGSPYISY